ncbi:homeodomain-like protein [Artemisia annua]|uniref:Homeodomain-like protein n=1 Tax=Artemisia annua TaxID=35608 RepID=A0A2U1PS67_ARTAN|nr:homeodomain-like protein [Artemisia annua]
MPQRKLPTVVLRRSPRFHDIEHSDSEYTKTPFLKEHRWTHRAPKQVSEESKGRWEADRRMTGSCCKDTNKVTKIDCGGSPRRKLDRPMTRSYKDPDNIAKKIDCVGTSKCSKGNTLRNRVKGNTKSRNDDCDRDDEVVVDNKMNKTPFSVKEHHILDNKLSEKRIDKVGKGADGRTDEVPKRVGTKRKVNQAKDDVKLRQGWSKDQELALERAYLTANPTPHFWKKVSRMVPGKSAQECFDKIHCSYVTPPQTRPRSRAAGLVLQNSNLSASKLLDSSFQKVKKTSCRRQKSHVVQRTVRHMLQKQYKVEKDSEADLFSVLEPTLNLSAQPIIPVRLLSTPDSVKYKGEVHRQEGSSTIHRKSCSRFSSAYGTTIVSPPVLKQVKNIALHEKYIDQLNCREANRKAASSKQDKVLMSKSIKQDSSVKRKDAIKAAKFALLFNAKDAINHFQDQQVKALSSVFDDECGSDYEEDEGQDFS